jgi:hypothetical protein
VLADRVRARRLEMHTVPTEPPPSSST